MTYSNLNYSLGGHSQYANAQDQRYQARQQQFTQAPATLPSTHWSFVLGVSPNATTSEIKAAYRSLAKKAHADHGGNDAAMTRLNLAKDQAMKAVNNLRPSTDRT